MCNCSRFKCPNTKKLGHKQNRHSALLDINVLVDGKQKIIGYQCEYSNCGYYEFEGEDTRVGKYNG